MVRTLPVRVSRLAVALCGGFFALGAVHAESTIPVGFLRWTLPATTSAELRTSLNFPLANAATYSGPVASFTDSTVTVAGTPFTANALVATPSFVRFLSGAQAGRTIRVTANTANTLTLDTSDNSLQTVALNAAGFTLAAADRFEVVPANTIGSVFGGISGKSLLLIGNATESLADEVSLYNPRTLTWEYYYYQASLGRWVRPGSTADAGGTIIQPDESVLIVRRTNRAAVDLVTVGVVPSVAPLTKVEGNGAGKYTSTRLPVPITFAQLSLSNWTKGNSPIKADTLSLWNDALQKWDGYYQRLDGTWRKSGDNADQGSTIIPAGTVVGLIKRSPVSGATSFLSGPLPYTL